MVNVGMITSNTRESSGIRVAMKVSGFDLVALTDSTGEPTERVVVVVHGLHADYWLLEPTPLYKKTFDAFVE